MDINLFQSLCNNLRPAWYRRQCQPARHTPWDSPNPRYWRGQGFRALHGLKVHRRQQTNGRADRHSHDTAPAVVPHGDGQVGAPWLDAAGVAALLTTHLLHAYAHLLTVLAVPVVRDHARGSRLEPREGDQFPLSHRGDALAGLAPLLVGYQRPDRARRGS